MGNHLACQDYYCQNILYKPDWFSPSSYSITNNEKTNYRLEKGCITILPSDMIEISLKKKMMEMANIEQFEIPLNFQIDYPSTIDFYIRMEEIGFYIHLMFEDNNFSFYYSNNPQQIFRGKIKKMKKYYFSISFIKKNEYETLIKHSFESSHKKISSNEFSLHSQIPIFNDVGTHLSFDVSSAFPFLSTHSFNFFLD